MQGACAMATAVQKFETTRELLLFPPYILTGLLIPWTSQPASVLPIYPIRSCLCTVWNVPHAVGKGNQVQQGTHGLLGLSEASSLEGTAIRVSGPAGCTNLRALR